MAETKARFLADTIGAANTVTSADGSDLTLTTNADGEKVVQES